ncbi:MAG: helix-turn-helix domain-containing protein [Desulfonatronovibrionaceae bacterium]
MIKENIGSKIKKFRELEEIRLEELADRSGLDQNYIQSLEEGQMQPALGPLLKISRALGTRLGTFLDDTITQDPLVVRLKEREEEKSLLKGVDKPEALRFFSLGRGKSDRHMEPFYIEIFPESAEQNTLSSHEGEEFIVVVSGQVQVKYGQEIYVLKPGDSIYYNSVVPHHVSVLNQEKAEIYAVLYFPE